MPYLKPDFIGVGMPSCGTRWLYDQLESHAQIWMPCVKELHFFDRGMRARSAQKVHKKLWLPRFVPPIRPFLERKNGLRDIASQIEFLSSYLHGARAEQLAAIEQSTMTARSSDTEWSARDIENPGIVREDFEAYAAYFANAFDGKHGEVTPRYCELAPDYIKQIAEEFPATRFILNVRSPAELIFSRLTKKLRHGRKSASELERVLDGRSNDRKLNRYAVHMMKVVDKWTSTVDGSRLHVVTMESIRNRPEHTRAEIARFLGIDPQSSKFSRPADYNRKRRTSDDSARPDETLAALRTRIEQACEAEQTEYESRFGPA